MPSFSSSVLISGGARSLCSWEGYDWAPSLSRVTAATASTSAWSRPLGVMSLESGPADRSVTGDPPSIRSILFLCSLCLSFAGLLCAGAAAYELHHSLGSVPPVLSPLFCLLVPFRLPFFGLPLSHWTLNAVGMATGMDSAGAGAGGDSVHSPLMTCPTL